MNPSFFIGDQVLFSDAKKSRNEEALVTGMSVLRDSSERAIGWQYTIEFVAKKETMENVDENSLSAVMAFQRSYYRRL